MRSPVNTGQGPGWSVSSWNEGAEDTGPESGVQGPSRVAGAPHPVLGGQGEGRPGEGGLPADGGSLTAPYRRRAKSLKNSPR